MSLYDRNPEGKKPCIGRGCDTYQWVCEFCSSIGCQAHLDLVYRVTEDGIFLTAFHKHHLKEIYSLELSKAQDHQKQEVKEQICHICGISKPSINGKGICKECKYATTCKIRRCNNPIEGEYDMCDRCYRWALDHPCKQCDKKMPWPRNGVCHGCSQKWKMKMKCDLCDVSLYWPKTDVCGKCQDRWNGKFTCRYCHQGMDYPRRDQCESCCQQWGKNHTCRHCDKPLVYPRYNTCKECMNYY